MSEKVDRFLTANGLTPSNSLGHYGVPGMKWGQRKSRSSVKTAAKPKPSSTAKESRKTQRVTDRSRGAGKANSFTQKPQNRKMSDAELRNKLNRLQMEKQYRELTTSPKGKSFVKEVLADTGKQAARNLLGTAAKVGVQLALEAAAAKATGSNGKFLSAMVAAGQKKGK